MTYDLGGRRLTVTNELSHTNTFTYDAMNRVLTAKDNLNGMVTSTCDAAGNLETVTDALGKVTTYSYDAANRPTSVVDAVSGTTIYAYDANGNRTSVANPRGKTTTYVYDALNRVTSSTDPNNRTASLEHDAASNLTQRTDGRGLVTKYFYDAAGRLTRAEHWNGATFVDQVTYAYDALNNRTQMVDAVSGTTTYAYDALNRATSVTFPGNKVVSYQYSNVGNRSRVTYPDGKTVDYGYDAAGNLTSVTDWSSRQTAYAYNNAGNLTSTTFPSASGLTAAFTYDNAERLLSVTNKRSTTTLSSFTYSLNAAGNRSQVVDGSGTTTYAYDNLYRLTSVTYPGPTTDTYTYDANGNRLTKNATTYTYDNADQMTAAGGVSYGYDSNGNQTSRGSDTLAWDFENRMTSATVGGTATTYTYNGDGLRQSRSSGGTTSSYIWDVAAGLPQILQDTTGSSTTTYVYGLGLIYWADGSGNPTYRLTDGLGSTANLCDASGNVTDSWTYDVFGAVKTHTGTNGTEFTFTGEQNDPNGLEYLRARYFDPASGRFLGQDPLGDGYRYAGGNPVNRIDPTGLYTICGDNPDYGYICFDSTQVGLPACAGDDCHIYQGDGSAPGNIATLGDRFGQACVFSNAAVWNCDVAQDVAIDASDAVKASVFAAAVGALNGLRGNLSQLQIEDYERTLRALGLCLHQGGSLCGGTLNLQLSILAQDAPDCDQVEALGGFVAFGAAGLASLITQGPVRTIAKVLAVAGGITVLHSRCLQN